MAKLSGKAHFMGNILLTGWRIKPRPQKGEPRQLEPASHLPFLAILMGTAFGAPRTLQTQPLLSASTASGPQPEGTPLGPFTSSALPPGPPGISAYFPQPPSRPCSVYPETTAVPVLRIYHPIIAYKTWSVILRLMLTTIVLGCLPLREPLSAAATSWETFIFEGPCWLTFSGWRNRKSHKYCKYCVGIQSDSYLRREGSMGEQKAGCLRDWHYWGGQAEHVLI